MSRNPYQAWKEALPEFRLEAESGQFSACRDGLSFTLVTDGGRNWRLVLTIAGHVDLSAFHLNAVPKVADRVVTGDRTFDDQVVLLGNIWTVLGVDAGVRDALARLVEAGATLVHGTLIFQAEALKSVASVAQAERLLGRAETVLRSLARDPAEDPIDRVIARLKTEPREDARRRIEAALDARRDHPQVAQGLAALGLDEATAAGAESETAFAQLSRSMSRSSMVQHLLHKRPLWAVRFLLERWSTSVIAQFPGVWLKLRLVEANLEPDHWSKLVSGLISMPRTLESEQLLTVVLKRCKGDALKHACDLAELRFEQVDYEALIRRNPAPEYANRLLKRLMESSMEDADRDRLMTAAAPHCDLSSQELLVQIAEEKFGRVRSKAVETLGRVGDLGVLAVLEGLSTGLFRPDGLKAAATAAVESIRTRHRVPDAGALSISEQPRAQGALSEAPEGGDLAITE